MKVKGSYGRKKLCYNNAGDAGWSSLVARRAHNPKVAGSNPAPATISFPHTQINYSPNDIPRSYAGSQVKKF
jgi:hypothetical protein